MRRFRFFAVMVVVVLFVVGCSGLGLFSLQAAPTAVTLFGDVGDAAPAAVRVTLRNPGLSAVDFAVVSDRDWLTVIPVSGSLAAREQATLQVSVAACVAFGVEAGNLSVTAGEQDVEIAVNRECRDPRLTVDRVYVNQSVPAQDTSKTASERVALVADRGGLLRVFVTSNSEFADSAQVRFHYRIGSGPESSVPVPGPSSAPTTTDEGAPATTFNVVLPASAIQPNLQGYLAVAASVDGESVSVRYPASGWWAMAVETVPAADFTVVPVTYEGATPDVGTGEAYFEVTRRVYPLSESFDIQVRATPYAYGGMLGSYESWVGLLTQLTTLRTSDGSGRHYVGIVDPGSLGAIGGIAWLGGDDPVAAALSLDRYQKAPRTVAHELGHNWGRKHVPCGPFVNGTDAGYPHAGGLIGVWGYDVTTGEHISPSTFHDLMSYCGNDRWASDYTYQGVMTYRQQGALGDDESVAGAGRVPLLVVSGWTDGDRLELDPLVVLTGVAKAIEVGPFTLVAWDDGGREVLRVPFDMQSLSVHEFEAFHLAIPLPGGELRPFGRVVIERDGVVLLERTPPVRTSAALPTTVIRDADGGATVRWDARSFPTVLVRDGVDGPLLGQGVGGELRVRPSGGVLDLLLFDGLNTRREVVEF